MRIKAIVAYVKVRKKDVSARWARMQSEMNKSKMYEERLKTRSFLFGSILVSLIDFNSDQHWIYDDDYGVRPYGTILADTICSDRFDFDSKATVAHNFWCTINNSIVDAILFNFKWKNLVSTLPIRFAYVNRFRLISANPIGLISFTVRVINKVNEAFLLCIKSEEHFTGRKVPDMWHPWQASISHEKENKFLIRNWRRPRPK